MFFKKKPTENKPLLEFSIGGVTFPNSTAPEERAAYLAQLAEIGLVAPKDNGYFLSWPDFYELVDDPEHAESLSLLGLPPRNEARPALSSAGALTDTGFRINLDGWRNSNGTPLQAASPVRGGLLEIGKKKTLLRQPVWALVDAVIRFASLPSSARTVEMNYQSWGRIRRLALVAGANLDDFLTKTIVLTPETLNLELERLEDATIRVTPTFQDAPADWLERFDSLPTIPDYYHLSQPGGGLIHVAIAEPVKKVLREIKRMPGRVARGPRAQAFIRNPYAVLGEAADSVIPPESYEASLHSADIVFYTFELDFKQDGKGNILSVFLDLEATRAGAIPAYERCAFNSPGALSRLIEEIQSQLDEGYPCFNWEGSEVELRGDAGEKLAQLRTWHERWLHPVPAITYEEVYEFPDYAQRVIEIGERKPYYSPFIFKTEPTEPWLSTNTLVGFGESADSPITLIRTQADLDQFAAATAQAKAEGKEAFDYPGLDKPMPVREAEAMIPLVQGVINATCEGKPPPDKVEKSSQLRRAPLIETNIEAVGYAAVQSTAHLAFDKSRATDLSLPAALRADLKAHQRIGVAWLQHLWRNSPANCSGCLMADDMGLGKTLQLLAFIVWYLEQPNPLPVLIVAPVSLLENWQNEIKKFFVPGCTRVLTLYGKSLAEKKVAQSVIDKRLLEDGLTKFLIDGWLGNANLVLTTYETMRDLSISLGQQTWSIMVCDEAQKIKTPGTLVTDAAKAQKAGFKIACTGTPVENSLTDLWCLFDFVQPGLLGPLNRFGLNYRRPIENASGDAEQSQALEQLKALIEPQLLRRTKREVAKDLPIKYDDSYPHIQQKNRIALNDYQRQLYHEVIVDYQCMRQAAERATQRSNPILAVLHRLRAICADPKPNGLQPDTSLSVDAYCKQSPKFNWLIERLDEVCSKKEKVLIFTEYLDLQRALRHYLNLRYGFLPDCINGSIKNSSEASESRQKIIDRFQASNGFNVMILSPKAAGFGLNIQAANHVIHYTRPWNPAVEDQATDRAYRLGQTRDVHVYYPTVCADELLTFEAKLDDLLRRKRELASDMLNGTPTVSQDELADLLGEAGYAESIEAEAWITAEHLPRIVGRPFEALCRALWKCQGYNCLLTPATGDGGVDIVAIKGKFGLLIQCKASEAPRGLGWDAIKEIVAGAASYEQQFLDVKFSKVAVTNQFFNDNSIRQAELNGVSLIDSGILTEWLSLYPQSLKSLR
ncbi:MAG: SNF2-related protein [Methylococcales bacterium]|nr:SNF2-related protein [Methylococcales bacterium]